MRKLLSAFVLIGLLSSCMLGVQGNGKVEEANRSVEDFNRISVSGMFEVHLRQADENSLKVVADENLHELIESRVENGVLQISTKEDIGRAEELDLYIGLKDLEAMEFSGAVSVKNVGELSGAELHLESSGAAEIKLSVDYDQISIELSGASEIEMSGEADQLRLSSSGASEVKFFELKVDRMRLDLSGASDVEVSVEEDLSLEASGAAEIVYRGNPEISRSELSGAASLRKD